jgi:hypothetical protein
MRVLRDNAQTNYAAKSCPAPLAKQMRLFLHTAAYWQMLELREAIPKRHPLAIAEFAAPRQKPIKIGARILETSSRIHQTMASAFPQVELFQCPAGAFQPAGP